ncbi:hypothetical protein DFJ66_3259 [Saccharothrix variisporea]|uniref:Uncharacterized protein n=1 Tax=Saccharothrix variisporea TaxID=543527 RepID=A0A495XEP6_9PSEU|nr:hypothetical protein DFJ66_3259 [Saccharothrix variisporea]
MRYWPTANEPATYSGATTQEHYVAQIWIAEAGTLCVVWPLPGKMQPTAVTVAAELPEADALVRIAPDFGRDGPTVGTAQPGEAPPTWADFEALWNDLSRVLGQPAPYWPYSLRIPRLIENWAPQQTTTVYPAAPDLDIVPLLKLALALPAGSAEQRAVQHLATVAQHRATESAVQNLELVDELQRKRKSCFTRTTAVAARPLPFPEPGEMEAGVLRRGWQKILERTDQLAADCVRLAAMWDGGAHFPYASVERVNPATRYGAEWASRLRAPAERAAVYESLGRGGGDALIDPVSGAPVVREPDGSLFVAVPQRLNASGGQLTEVVLDEPVWIRTEDGSIQPAPRDHYWGLSWGYSGSGPGSLALLIHRLLDDITAPAADSAMGAPLGLDELTELKWPRESVLTRELLESARSGRSYPKPGAPVEDA